MNLKQVYQAVLIELEKQKAPSMLLDEFNYYYYKSVIQYINTKYNFCDMNQQEDDDLRVFNAPLIKTLSIIAVFKDPRQLEQFTCCNAEEVSNMNFLTNDIKRRITEKKVRWYRSLAAPNLPNDQVAKA